MEWKRIVFRSLSRISRRLHPIVAFQNISSRSLSPSKCYRFSAETLPTLPVSEELSDYRRSPGLPLLFLSYCSIRLPSCCHCWSKVTSCRCNLVPSVPTFPLLKMKGLRGLKRISLLHSDGNRLENCLKIFFNTVKLFPQR